MGCSRPHARSFPNNRSLVHLYADVALQAVLGMAPEESSMALLQKAAELLLRRTDQPEHWRCRSPPPHFDPPAGQDGEVLSTTTRKRIGHNIARERTLNIPLTFFGLEAETVTGCGPVCREKKPRLMRDCIGMDWSISGPCREGMKTFHKRRGDRRLRSWEGREEPYTSKG